MGDIDRMELTEKDVDMLTDALVEVVRDIYRARDSLSDRAAQEALLSRIKEIERLRDALCDLVALPF